MGQGPALRRLILASILPLLGGCHSSIQEVCDQRLRPFQLDLARARSEFQTGRALASNGDISALEQKESWLGWAEDQLRETQFFLELTEKYPKYRDERAQITQLANHIVAFYGYVEQGNTHGAKRTLGAISEYSAGLEASFCRPAEKVDDVENASAGLKS